MSDDYYEFAVWAGDEITRLQTGINVRRPSEFQSLFKYISLSSETSWEHLARRLEKSELVGSAAISLNDPFETLPSYFDDLNPEVIANAIGHNGLLDRLEGRELPIGELFADKSQFLEQAKRYLSDISSRYGIISFSERSDSQLL